MIKMIKLFKYKILGLALLVVVIVACDTANQDVSPVISPDGYPVATFTSNFSGTTIAEGDTIKYTITTDKMLDRALTFTVEQTGGTANENDFSAETAVLAPYTNQVKLNIVITADNFPEIAETLSLKVGVFGLGDRYLLNPSTVNPALDLNITNVNKAGRLTIAFGWSTPADDYDVVAFSAVDGPWGAAGTADNPEIMMDILDADPDGAYTFNIIPYAVTSVKTDYTISIGLSNQSVQFFPGVFDNSKLDTYTMDVFTVASWGNPDSYRLLNIVKTGSAYTFTQLKK